MMIGETAGAAQKVVKRPKLESLLAKSVDRRFVFGRPADTPPRPFKIRGARRALHGLLLCLPRDPFFFDELNTERGAGFRVSRGFFCFGTSPSVFLAFLRE